MEKLGIAAIVLTGLAVSFSGCASEEVGSSPGYYSGQAVSTPPSGAAPTPNELIEVLGSRNVELAVSVMNRIKRERYKSDLIEILDGIWRNDITIVDQVDGEFVNSPRIRVEIADVLIQESRSGTRGLDFHGYAAFAREHALSSDPDAARQAILVLGVANDASDVGLLKRLLRSEERETFSAAAIAISHSCAISKPELVELQKELQNPVNSDYLEHTWNNLATLRKAVCSSH